MSDFHDLNPKALRDLLDQQQIWEAWIAAEDERRQSFAGSMSFEDRAGSEYLYKRIGRSGKSLGRRSAKTENILERFLAGKSRNAERLKSLSEQMDRNAIVLRSLGVGRVPLPAARLLRAIRISSPDSTLRVVGTNALHCYEAMAGARFSSEQTATIDFDLLHDDRNRLRLMTEDRRDIGLLGIATNMVDKSFTKRASNDFRMTNDDGYMIELIRPEIRPPARMRAGTDPFAEGLQWLVNAPSVESVAIDERGYPVPMRAPDPRVWMAHKFWLSQKDDRPVGKKRRDHMQASSMMDLLVERLPGFPLDQEFRDHLPAELALHLPVIPEKERSGPDW